LNPSNWTISASINSESYYEGNLNNNYYSDGNVEGRQLSAGLFVGDINGDGVVNILDAIILSRAFPSHLGTQEWNAQADINMDNYVNILDAIILANHFGHATGGGSLGSDDPPEGKERGTAGTTNVAVDPTQVTIFKGEPFVVNINLNDVTDLRGWEFKLLWNSTVLNCTDIAIQTPAVWQNGTLDFGPGLENDYNITHGRFYWGQAANSSAPSFNGSMTLATLTFQALHGGTTSLSLVDPVLGDSNATAMACTVSSGTVNVYYGRYMRSDTQTVNGLNAYKLNLPQSASYTYYTRSGSGFGASWGIRAWVRHSNGTEQEISLNGQTGTPTAMVSRSSGSGFLSGTVSVAQTGLQSTDSLVVRVYVQIEESGWNLCASFTTEQLQASSLQAATWTVYYYTYASHNWRTDTTTSIFYWGTTTYNTRIQNLQYN